MKILIVYYSRTGTTKKVAEELAKKLDADVEEIIDLKNRNGMLGYISAGRDASLKKLTRISPIDKKPSKYDLIIIGGPVWSWSLCTPIRSYVHQNKSFMKEKTVAFFCTMGGSGDKGFFEQLENILETGPVARLTLLTREVRRLENKHSTEKKINEFVDVIKKISVLE